MKRTGRGRSAAILAVFLGAASFDGSWQGAARLDWLLFPLASLAVGLLLRKAAGRGGKRARLALLPLAVTLAGADLGRLCLFVTSHNDFHLSPRLIVLTAAGTLCLLALTDGGGYGRLFDLTVFWIAALTVLWFCTGGLHWDVGRLLPLRAGAEEGRRLLTLLAAPFLQGLIAVSLPDGETREDDLRCAVLPGCLLAGTALGLERLRLTCTVGFEVASKLAFPTYAAASVQYAGSYGFHVEEALLCAVFAGRLLRDTLLLRFCRETLRGKGSGVPALLVCAAAATIMGVTALSTVGGAGRWNALMPYVTLGSAVLWGCCMLLDRRKKSN